VLQAEGGSSNGTVLAHLNYCGTPFGKRLLRQWISRPLLAVSDIRHRQDAVAELIDSAMPAMEEASALLQSVGDIERAVVRLSAASAGALGRDAPGVVLYEDSSKRKVHAVTALLQGFQRVQAVVNSFVGVQVVAAALVRVLTWGEGMPDFRDELADLLGATDWKQAEEKGRVVPNVGVDKSYDDALALVQSADGDLQVRFCGWMCHVVPAPVALPRPACHPGSVQQATLMLVPVLACTPRYHAIACVHLCR
jgi:DNA mismatch repair protein MSH6